MIYTLYALLYGLLKSYVYRLTYNFFLVGVLFYGYKQSGTGY